MTMAGHGVVMVVEQKLKRAAYRRGAGADERDGSRAGELRLPPQQPRHDHDRERARTQAAWDWE